MNKCKYCNGMGYVQADVGQVFECEPCGATGNAKAIKNYNRKAVAIQCVRVYSTPGVFFSNEENYFTAGKVYPVVEGDVEGSELVEADNGQRLYLQLERVELLVPGFHSTFRHVYAGDPVLTEKKVTH